MGFVWMSACNPENSLVSYLTPARKTYLGKTIPPTHVVIGEHGILLKQQIGL